MFNFLNLPLHNYLQDSFRDEIIENRETCSHFIDYEIYDSLTDRLKEKYVKQFPVPQFIYYHNDKKLGVRCQDNHNDLPQFNSCDCTEFYKKTLKNMLDRFTQNTMEPDESNRPRKTSST